MRVACCMWLSVMLTAAMTASTGAAAVLRTTVGPMQLVSPVFGYTVVSRLTETRGRVRSTVGLYLYDHGRWRNATPPGLRRDNIDVIDDVAFVDSLHGWVAGFNCASTRVHLYRTSEGGKSWQSLGAPASHSCGGGPTYLSFPDRAHGWMEPVSPNGPVGELLGTADGGRTWKRLATGPSTQIRQPALPCLAPIRFVSPSTGWMGRCAFAGAAGAVYATRDSGRRWARVAVPTPMKANARFDVPRFFGDVGVVAATMGAQPSDEPGHSKSVVFSVTGDGGRRWSIRSTRSIGSCPLAANFGQVWPAAIATPRVWWVVAGAAQPVAQVTLNAGRTWRAVAARGLPARRCAVVAVSAADAQEAWVVARENGESTALFQSSDGGRTWARARLSPG